MVVCVDHPRQYEVDFGKVLIGPGVCVGKGGSDHNVLRPGVNVRSLSSVGLNQTHLASLPDSSDWEYGGWSDWISEQIVYV